MSFNTDNLVLRPSESEPGEVIVTPQAGDIFLGADSRIVDRNYEVAGAIQPTYGVGEQEVPRAVPQAEEEYQGEAVPATIADTLNSAASTVKNAASSMAQAVNRSGAIPRAKELASSAATTVASGVRQAGSAVSQTVSSATAPSAEVSPVTESSATTIEIPTGSTIVVPEGTNVLTAEGTAIGSTAPRTATVGSTETSIGAPNVVSGARTAGSTAGSVAGTVAGTVGTLASMAKNTAVSATNAIFGAGTTQQLGQSVENAGEYVQGTAQNAKNAVVGQAQGLKQSAQGTAENVKESAKETAQNVAQSTQPTAQSVKESTQETAGNISGSAGSAAQNIKATAETYAPETTRSVENAAENTKQYVQGTAANATQYVQETAENIRQQGIKPTATSVLAKAGSVAGTVVGAVAGVVTASAHMAADMTASALHRTTGHTEVVPGMHWTPKEDVGAPVRVEAEYEETPRARGERKAHEIENTAAEKVYEAREIVVEKKEQAVNAARDVANTVASSQPVQATTTATKQAYNKAQENTIAAGTLAGDVAHTAYEKTANVASATYNTAANVAHTAYDKSANVAGATYNTAANVAHTAYDKTANVAGATYNTAANVTNATVGTVYNTAANVAHTAYDTTANVAGATYNTAANVAHTAYDKTANAAGATYNTAANVTNASVESAKNVAGSAYNKAASTVNTAKNITTQPRTTESVHTETVGHQGSPAGIAGTYGSSAPHQAEDALTSDAAIEAVTIPSDRRSAEQQAAVDAALSRNLEPIGISSRADSTPANIETPLSEETSTFGMMDVPVQSDLETSEQSEYPLSEIVPSYDTNVTPSASSTLDQLRGNYKSSNYKSGDYKSGNYKSGDYQRPTSVLPSDLSPRELSAPPSDATSTRSIPPSDNLQSRLGELSANPTYEEQRAEIPAERHEGQTADLTNQSGIASKDPRVYTPSPVPNKDGKSHSEGVMSKLAHKVEKLMHKEHVEGTGSEKHRVAQAEGF